MLNITCGWGVYDVVKVFKSWCCMCTKSTYHEQYQEHVACLNCNHTYIAEAVA